MDIETKKLADNRDLKSLKYIFVDSLDVDPTFVRYEEEYNYCKSIPGLLEQYIELNPFTSDKTKWDEAYWTKLKMDLVKNFSDQRMMHMREVARVFLAEKIQRILAERANSSMTPRTEPEKVIVAPTPDYPTRKEMPVRPNMSQRELQEREIQVEKGRLARDNREAEAKQQAEKARIEQLRSQNQNTTVSSGTESKKMLGIAIAAVAVIVVVAAILILK